MKAFRLLLLLLLASGADAQTYYVATDGSDAWSGTLATPDDGRTDGPFLTLGKAQRAMRASSVKTTTLRAGTYTLTGDWRFDSRDGGQTWTGYPGEAAVIDGDNRYHIAGEAVSEWTWQHLTFTRTNGVDLFGTSFGPAGLYCSGCDRVTVKNSDFIDCVKACITGAGVAREFLIYNNVFSGQRPGNHQGDTGSFYAAVMLWYGASNNVVEHNLFRDLQGGAVIIATGVANPAGNNNRIDRNVAVSVCDDVVDCGAYYLYDATHSAVGNSITNNIADGVGGDGYTSNWTKCYYIDDLMSHVTVAGNICRGGGMFATQIHAGDHVTFENNIFDLSRAGVRLAEYDRSPVGDFGMSGNVYRRNILYWGKGSTPPESLWYINITREDVAPTMDGNLYYAEEGGPIPEREVTDARRLVRDPRFANAAVGDYSMPPDSAAYTEMGFVPLVTDQGLLPGLRRASGPPTGTSSSGGH